jgi:hypothetical protein
MDGGESVDNSLPESPEILLEGELLKLSRNKVWQERHFCFTSEHILSYSHKQGDYLEPNANYKITRDAGCKISDLYVEQRLKGSKKESLYCMTFTWEDAYEDSSADLGSTYHGEVASLIDPLTPISEPILKSDLHENRSAGYIKEGCRNFFPANVKRKFRIGKTRNRSRGTSFDSAEENSISSAGTGTPSFGSPGLYQGRNSKRPFFDDESYNSGRERKGLLIPFRKSNRKASVPSVVKMDAPQKFPEYESIAEASEHEKSPIQGPRQTLDVRMSNPSDPGNTTPGGTDKKYEERHATEQEKLHDQFFDKEKRKTKGYQKKVIERTKLAAATGAAVGVGVLTAGVGLAAGLVVIGAAAAAGGTAGVAEVGLKKFVKKHGKLIVATSNYEEAKLWKSSLEASLESESMKSSTWGRKFVAEGRRTTAALMPHDVELMAKHNALMTAVKDNSSRGIISTSNLPDGQKNLFLRDRSFFGEANSAQWRPLEGGWSSLLGPGAQSLRIFREERVEVEKKSKKIFRLAVGGSSTCAPLKAQIILNVHTLDAFMCLMSYSRVDERRLDINPFTPKSGHNASFRVLEKIDDHTDIVHLFCRKLFLFPSWTEPRDFVLFRYWRYEADGSYFVCYESVEHSACPPQPGFVRGELHQVCTLAPTKRPSGRRKLQIPNIPECMLTSVVQVDPKGWVPTKPIPFLCSQTYTDAFGVAALLQMLDIRDSIENDRFLDVAPPLTINTPFSRSNGALLSATTENVSYDVRYADRERVDVSVHFSVKTECGLETTPPSLKAEKWAEPDANTFVVRGPSYKKNRKKFNAGTSIGRLVAVDLVNVDQLIYSGMCTHPTERIQMALAKERDRKKAGKASDMPPFVFVVNICFPGPPYYHAVFYYAVDDMSTIDGTDGTGSSLLCKEFLFGDSDEFRDKTFKLIPQIVEGNFMVRKAVGSTPAIMGTKLAQYYARSDRFMEVILDCGSSQVATGVIRLCLGYAKTLMIDMGFLLEADEVDYLPEQIFGCVRMKFPDFGPEFVRKVEDPSKV